jgi:hypothetical protein
MRRLIGLCVLCAALLVTVSGCFRDLLLDDTETKEEYDEIKTYVRFNNAGEFPVEVFVDPERSIPLCSIDAKNSETVVVTPDTHANTYYLIYHILFHGATLPYAGQYMTLSVRPAGITEGIIPRLPDLSVEERAKQFAADVYIYMDNTSSTALSLLRGSSGNGTPIGLVDGIYVLNARSKGLYKLSGSGNSQLGVESYGFYRNSTDILSWPAGITGNFEKGYLYSFEFPGSGSTIRLQGKWEMTIANVLNQKK